jgi:hypothetical protein
VEVAVAARAAGVAGLLALVAGCWETGKVRPMEQRVNRAWSKRAIGPFSTMFERSS